MHRTSQGISHNAEQESDGVTSDIMITLGIQGLWLTLKSGSEVLFRRYNIVGTWLKTRNL
jgi:hypothetical protein